MTGTEIIRNCKNCGAPATSEICPYCGCPTGLDTETANMDYPTLECKEANINFWTVLFPLVFAIGFGIAGIITLVIAFSPDIMNEELRGSDTGTGLMVLISIPFLAIGIGAAVFTVLPVYRYFLIKRNGKRIEAIVYGYTDDNVKMNDRPAQVVKLLIDTPNGKRFIMYQLGNTSRPFGINTTIYLKVYRNHFMIDSNGEIINW